MNKFGLCLVIGLLVLGFGLSQAVSSGENQTWRDTKSGLMWETRPSFNEMDGKSAYTHCKDLFLGGFSDWRLPSISELRSLIRGCPATQKGGSCKVKEGCMPPIDCASKSCDGCLPKRGPGRNGTYLPKQIFAPFNDCWSASSGPPMTHWVVNFNTGGIEPQNMYDDEVNPGTTDYKSYTICVRN